MEVSMCKIEKLSQIKNSLDNTHFTIKNKAQ